ncbi:sugar efflux transporter [Celerinatantimonas sp. YJH-8]|uniref:sugar efflux transporter n=1 Tax=Celerinatantimonas sp. YJH-8 TaxID=3228714 RepID=UPI0038C4D148
MLATYWRNFRSHQSAVLLSFMSLSFFSGLGSALFAPILSLFLTNQVHVSPFAVGLFYTINAIGGIIFSQLIARYSDRKGHRKRIILICLLMGALNCLLFDWCRNYYILISLGIFLMSIGASAMPQTFALARDYKDHAGERSVMFTSVMRSQLSLAWVIGPTIAFALVAAYGFKTLFMAGMGIYIIAFVVTLFKLPDMPKQSATGGTHQHHLKTNQDVFKLFIASTLMWGCNSMYIISMPLYISHQLHLPQELAGWMMGTAAALEIPVMLIASYLTKYWRMKTLLILACVAGLLFYIGMDFIHSAHLLIVIQLGNAAFIGILGGLGMIYFQDLMPGRSGQATTLFSNSLYTGNVIAGALAGIIAQYVSYGATFWVGGGFVAIAAFTLSRIKPI